MTTTIGDKSLSLGPRDAFWWCQRMLLAPKWPASETMLCNMFEQQRFLRVD